MESPVTASAFQPRDVIWDLGVAAGVAAGGSRFPRRHSMGFHADPGTVGQSPTVPGTRTLSPVADGAFDQPGTLMVHACPQELSGKWPLSWSKDDVEGWLEWCVKEFSLGGVDLRRFSMNGKALCLLNKEGFRHRTPYAGDVLHELLQKLLRKGRMHACQSVASMQMNSTPSANETITLARHLCSETTALNRKAFQENLDYAQDVAPIPSCTHSPNSRRPDSKPHSDDHSNEHTVNRRYHKDSGETMPLNLKITEAASESLSDSGISACSSQDLAEERDSQPAHPLAGVNVYTCFPARSEARSSLAAESSYKRASPLSYAGFPASDSFFPTYPTSDTVSDALRIPRIKPSSPLPEQTGWPWWNGHPTVGYLTNYNLSTHGWPAEIDAARRHREVRHAGWRDLYLKEERDRSPVRSRAQGQEAKPLHGSPGMPSPQCSIADDHSRHQGPRSMRCARDVSVIRTTENIRHHSSHSANNVAVCVESISQPAPLEPLPREPLEVVNDTLSGARHSAYSRTSPSRETGAGSGFTKVQSSLFSRQCQMDSSTTSSASKRALQEGSCKQKGECRLLWDFLAQLLGDGKYAPYIRWEERDRLVFRIVDPTAVAEMWGRQKNRNNMTYEKLSRALRYYYRANIIAKVPGQKLTYRFLQDPKDIANAPRFSKANKKERVASHEGALTFDGTSPSGGAIIPGRSDHSSDSGAESVSSESTVVATPTDAVETTGMETYVCTEQEFVSIKEEPV